MENTQDKKSDGFIKYTATYGAYLGIALVAVSLVDYMLNMYGTSSFMNAISYAVFIGGIVGATLAYRSKALGGYIGYGQALRFGTMLCTFAAVILGAYMAILVNFIDPAYLEKNFDIVAENMAASGAYTEDQIDMAMSMSRSMTTPLSMVLISMLTYSILGFLVSLVTSIFIKKENPNPSF